MWGYQPHFQVALQYRADGVFDLLGADIKPHVFLVGLRSDDIKEGQQVCVEPESEEWPAELFKNLEGAVAERVASHPLNRMHYGDAQAMRDKPVHIKLASIGEAVKRCLSTQDQLLDRRSFCSRACRVGNYYVVCVIQVAASLLRQHPPIKVRWREDVSETSIIHSCIDQLLREGQAGLALPEPGRALGDDGMRHPTEILRRAASSFMRNPFVPNEHSFSDFFEDVNRLSQHLYEGKSNRGHLVLAPTNDPNVEYVMRLEKSVPLSETRWARKLLQMAAGDYGLVVGQGSIAGVGKVSNVSAAPFCVEFLDHHQWDFRQGEQVLLRCRFGDVRLPQEPIGKERFIDNMRRVFPGIEETSIERFRIVLDLLTQLRHGSSLVIAADAAAEAKRLARQGTVIEPTPLTQEVLRRATMIDGSILVDTSGVCHAVGVILDGQAVEDSTPSRGSRYNSAVRYVAAGKPPRMVFVMSDDRTLDVVPLLRLRVDRNSITAAVQEISTATADDYHRSRNFLDENRFYLSEEQCQIVNDALDRIEKSSREMGQITIITSRFKPHILMNDSYLSD
ncbi:MAG: hypothetical protein Q8R85_17755 [Bosea sp. (in: a-proteobacteria)]|uniref:hypothetical protein n=1 Tax=Bosea sp. (in: a-proteobacteria) TaxID=1871050 RepID=UPI002732792A|nr:hypothetical protein [Bosea sp. (in: a-proteobacteria)]MDP3603009.1 hypothetical protein [Bosea sp. (in: a-proteobacteria)]